MRPNFCNIYEANIGSFSSQWTKLDFEMFNSPDTLWILLAEFAFMSTAHTVDYPLF